MLDLSISVEGIEELQRLLRQMPEMYPLVVEDAARTIRNLVIGRTPVGAVDGGTLKGSWSDVQRTATGFTFGTDVPYAQVLEEGGYLGVGPRTIATEGGIFSRQAPGGIIGPLLRDETLLNRVVTSVADGLLKEIQRAQ